MLVLMMGLLAGCGSKGDEANKRGLEYYANGQYEAAAEAFSEAIAKDNAVTEFYLNRVMALIKLERYQDAATSLSYAQHLEPDTTEVARAKGILYYAQGQYQSALDSFKTAVANNSGKAGEMVIDILRYTAACQMELLQYAAPVITAEDGIRFLTDHINGDTYYHIDYEGQNLDRARTQLLLLDDMEVKLPEIRKILQKIYDDLGLDFKFKS